MFIIWLLDSTSSRDHHTNTAPEYDFLQQVSTIPLPWYLMVTCLVSACSHVLEQYNHDDLYLRSQLVAV
jgi:alcohol dehydrogenase YqhD (iron-dependent ADH family)